MLYKPMFPPLRVEPSSINRGREWPLERFSCCCCCCCCCCCWSCKSCCCWN
ncbi:unnamed protein product [Spirodela intermedia]|uniref:Uncharacterized protein n=1 Tax=Spirodela intermedia TaxID=51605 RepID=A0A7I8JEM6_SPIIN|nr:unnamed protein product [Spirodela intermedia]CAA6667852.1 unnamed protein product [Spirodela intermedia]